MRIYRIPKAVQRIFSDIIWSFPEKKNNVFFTFDDGPHKVFTPQILDILEEQNVKATFFLLGINVKPNKEIVLRMQDAGHSLGIHGYSHDSLLFKSKKYICEQIERAKDELEYQTGEPVRLFRPPYGMFNRAVLKLCRQLSLRLVLWSFMTYDFDNRLGEDYLLKMFQKKICPGDIVTLHDGLSNSDRTVRMLPHLIRYSRTKVRISNHVINLTSLTSPSSNTTSAA